GTHVSVKEAQSHEWRMQNAQWIILHSQFSIVHYDFSGMEGVPLQRAPDEAGGGGAGAATCWFLGDAYSTVCRKGPWDSNGHQAEPLGIDTEDSPIIPLLIAPD